MFSRLTAAGILILLTKCDAGGQTGNRPLLAKGPVVVTGATGRTGSLIYNLLKSKSHTVRGFVRNVSKARQLLGCSKCDESEGIYVGDVTQPATLVAPMQGAGSLAIVTSAAPICNPYPKCSFPQGAYPVDIDWIGAKAQLAAFATATKDSGLGPVILVSTMGTTEPEAANDTFQHISFYKLNFEAALMASGLPFTIVKPCGLSNTAPATKELVVGHDDSLKLDPPTIARADVARLVVASVEQPSTSAGLRFDVCSRDGTPTTDGNLPKVLEAARYPWDRRSVKTRSQLTV